MTAERVGLQVTHLVKRFGGVHAVDDVSFSVSEGECTALIGPNGAGKSTLFACIAGQHPLTAGEVHWHGIRLDHLAPAARLRHGVSRTFQVAQTFEALGVRQNVQLALAAPALSAWRALAGVEVGAADRILERLGLTPLADEAAADLPYGARKRLELGIALAGLSATGPRLLLLDEPAAGLAAAERKELMALVRSLVTEGVTVLYTEHNMDAVFGVADRVLVLIDGQLAASGPPDAVAQDDLVRGRYLGHDFGFGSGGGA